MRYERIPDKLNFLWSNILFIFKINLPLSWTDNLIYLNCLNRKLYYPINKSKIVNQSLMAGFTSKSRFIERKHLCLCLSIFSLHFSLIKKKKKRKSNYSVYLSVQLQIQLFHDYGEQSKGGEKMCRFGRSELREIEWPRRGKWPSWIIVVIGGRH